VQHQHRCARAVLDVVDTHPTDIELHTRDSTEAVGPGPDQRT
jgi:hypothetical protein